MSTLVELNETLKQQGDKLGSIDKGISSLVKKMSGDSLEDLERKRDSKEGRGVLRGFMGGSNRKSKSGGGDGLLSNFGFGLGGFGLGALGVGGLLKSFGGIGVALAGISYVMTPENIKKTEELFKTLSDVKDSIGSYFEGIDINLPSMEDIGKKIQSITGSVIDTFNNILNLDFDAIGDTLATNASDLAVAAGITKSKLNQRKGKTPPKPDPKPKPTDMSKGDRQKVNAETGKNLSQRKIKALEKQGYKVNKDGALTKGGKAVSVDETDKAFKKAGIKTSTQKGILKRFPRVMKLLKVPGIGTALSVGSIVATLADDSLSKDDKIAQIASSLGGIGGGLLGAAAGATIGTAVLPAFGTLIGGLLGGAGGALFGEELAGSIAKWALGGDNSGIKELEKLSKQVDSNSVAGQSAMADDPFAMSMPTPKPKQQKGFTPAVEGQALRALQSTRDSLQNATPSVTVVSPTTTNVTNGSTSVSFGGGVSVMDSLDQGTR